MSKRNYKSKSLYHTDRKAYYEQKEEGQKISANVTKSDFFDSDPEKMIGYVGGSWEGRAGLGRGLNFLGVNSELKDRFPNLVGNGTLYRENGGYITISEVVWLTQKAWEEFQLFRNTIEAMVEFSMSDIKLSSKNKSAKTFCETWIRAAKIHDFSEQFYRELYRSCNVFAYPIKGKIAQKDVKSLKMYANEAEIPVKYTILNPAQVALLGGITSDYEMYKILSPYEIKRLKNPSTQAEKILYQKLTPEVKKAIKDFAGITTQRLYVPITDVKATFYQKQDYEYFAVPLFYGVLDDIELKLEMKKADRKVLKTVENVILKVTLGGYKGPDGEELPPNPEHMVYLRKLFQNQEAQKVLIGDYTMKGEYIIPEISKVVGEAKYKQVNEDIREGLQSIFGGNEKFSNVSTKAKIFLERLKKGQGQFKEWLEGELSNICNAMGFSETPKVKLSTIDLEDQTQKHRAFIRMGELGFLTPEELTEAMETGILPNQTESEESQKKYRKLKDDGLYEPQMNYNPADEETEGGDKKKAPKDNGRPAGATQKLSAPRQQRVVGNIEGISVKTIKDCLFEMDKIKAKFESSLKKAYKKKSLTVDQISFAHDLAQQVVSNYEKKDWDKAISSVIETKEIENNQKMNEEIETICADFDLDDEFLGALVYHAKCGAPK